VGLFDKFRKKEAAADAEPRVQIYDPDTHSLSTIPARELAPGMVRAHVTGIDGDCWIDPSKLKQSEYRHPPFDEEVRKYLREIKDTLDEVYSLTLDEWEDGFRRDTTAEREIAIWLHIAEKYRECTSGKQLNLAEKQDVFKIVLSCANNPRDQVLTVAGVTTLSRPEAEEIVETFYRKDQ